MKTCECEGGCEGGCESEQGMLAPRGSDFTVSSRFHETDREIARSRARSREQEAWLNLLPDDKEA